MSVWPRAEEQLLGFSMSMPQTDKTTPSALRPPLITKQEGNGKAHVIIIRVKCGPCRAWVGSVFSKPVKFADKMFLGPLLMNIERWGASDFGRMKKAHFILTTSPTYSKALLSLTMHHSACYEKYVCNFGKRNENIQGA